MANEHTSRIWTKTLNGVVAGAAAMYVLDPDRGRRRRALARDRVRSTVSDTVRTLRQATRDARNRLGAAWETRRKAAEPADDLVLAERARSEMGRTVSHPHAIRIDARGGCLIVSGHILKREVEPLLSALRGVRGVEAVEQRMEVHESAEGVSSLRGGRVRRLRRRERALDNWTPSLRVAAVASGGMLTALGLRQRSALGMALAAVGVALAARGVSNVPLRRFAGLEGRRAIELHRSSSAPSSRG